MIYGHVSWPLQCSWVVQDYRSDCFLWNQISWHDSPIKCLHLSLTPAIIYQLRTKMRTGLLVPDQVDLQSEAPHTRDSCSATTRQSDSEIRVLDFLIILIILIILLLHILICCIILVTQPFRWKIYLIYTWVFKLFETMFDAMLYKSHDGLLEVSQSRLPAVSLSVSWPIDKNC